MPLRQGCSKDSFEYNLKKLMEEGRETDQAFAISSDIARDNKGRCGLERQLEIEAGDFL